jgi:hypothetical protein
LDALGLQLGVLGWIVQVDGDQGAGHGSWLCLICVRLAEYG